MEKTSPWASLYFIFLMTVGNYILINLLIAIIVDGFVAVGFGQSVADGVMGIAETVDGLIEGVDMRHAGESA